MAFGENPATSCLAGVSSGSESVFSFNGVFVSNGSLFSDTLGSSWVGELETVMGSAINLDGIASSAGLIIVPLMAVGMVTVLGISLMVGD